MNLVRIAEACAVECVRQKVGLMQLAYLIRAYQGLMGENPIAFTHPNHIMVLGREIEPVKNMRGFRTRPVTFQNGGSSAHHSEIPRLMNRLVADIQFFFDSPPVFGRDAEAAQLTKQFLWIHPFVDGNGRTGFLLYNYLMGTLDEPLALPDFQW